MGLTGHKYLRNKLAHSDVSSCRFFPPRKILSSLHVDGIVTVYVSVHRGREGVRLHTIDPHWPDIVVQAPPGGVWVGVLSFFLSGRFPFILSFW